MESNLNESIEFTTCPTRDMIEVEGMQTSLKNNLKKTNHYSILN